MHEAETETEVVSLAGGLAGTLAWAFAKTWSCRREYNTVIDVHLKYLKNSSFAPVVAPC